MFDIVQVQNVWIEYVGTNITVTVAAGATVLTLEDDSNFGESGQVSIDDVVYAYAHVEDSGQITISPGLVTAINVDTGDPVRVFTYPLLEEKWASVVRVGEAGGENIRVAHSLQDKLAPGVRDPGEMENVVMAWEENDEGDDGDWVLTDLLAQTPSIDGSYIETGTIPTSQTYSTLDPPDPIPDGYDEGHAWWKVDDTKTPPEVVGFWRLVNGAWVSTSPVSFDVLTATSAFVEALGAYDFTVINNLVAQGPTELRGPTTLSNTETLTSSASVPAPNVPPSSTMEDASTPVVGTWPGSAAVGLGDDGGSNWLMATSISGVKGIQEVDKTTGALGTFHPVDTTHGGGALSAVENCVKIGTNYYVMTYIASPAQMHCQKYDSSWNYVSEFLISHTGGSGGSYIPNCMGTNGTDLLFQYGSHIYRTSTAGVELQDITLNVAPSTFCYGVIGGNFDFGATRYIVIGSPADFDNIFVYNSSGTRQTGDEWMQAHISARGIAWDGTRFHTVDSSGRVYHYAQQLTTVSGLESSEALTDGTARTIDGTPSASFTWTKRRWLRVTVPDYPSSPAGLYGVYYAGATTRYFQTVSPALSTSNKTGLVDKLATSGTTPAATGSFGTSPLGKIASASETVPGTPDVDLRGTGSWYLNPSKNLDDTGWVDLSSNIVAGDSPFTGTASNWFVGRRIGKLVRIEMSRAAVAAYTPAGGKATPEGNFTNINVAGPGTVPAAWRPSTHTTNWIAGPAKFDDTPVVVMIRAVDGAILLVGGHYRTWALGDNIEFSFQFLLD